MATITFETFVGAGPAWADNGANTLTFSGSLTDPTVPITVAAFQDGTHISSGSPGTDQCGANHANNVKYISGTEMSVDGGATENLNDTNLLADECSLRLHFNHTSAVAVSGARLFCFDGAVDANYAPDIDMFAFERGQTDTAWTQINNGSGATGGDNVGERLDLADGASAQDHYWYIALSVSPESVGAKNAAIKLALTYS